MTLGILAAGGRVAASCGDGTRDSGEECDDGGLADGDGCSAVCVLECALTGTWWSIYPGGTGPRWDLVEQPAGVVRGFLHVSPLPGEISGTRGAGNVSLSVLCSDPEHCTTLVRSLVDCDTLPIDANVFGTLQRASTSACGDAILDVGEECDDGNWTNGDLCTEDCRSAECGNEVLEPGEECDDGNVSDGDGCTATCTAQVCGNGQVEAGEACDDANTASNDGCTECRVQVCGNGVLEPSEQCDDGNTVADDGCSPACVAELPCTLTGTWQSVYAFPLPAAALEWRLVEDAGGAILGSLRAGLIGTTVNGSRQGARVDLSLFCNPGGCPSYTLDLIDCDTLPIDAILFGTLERRSHSVCGNGQIEAGEECDSGSFAGSDECNSACLRPWCGNGVVDALEECDDGNRIVGDSCDPSCTESRCGNRIIDQGEQCDDGNTLDGDGCSGSCALFGCPNSTLDDGEQCDDGNVLDGDGCARNCRLPGCGNWIVEAGESCDDGNAAPCDGCDVSCQVEADDDIDCDTP